MWLCVYPLGQRYPVCSCDGQLRGKSFRVCVEIRKFPQSFQEHSELPCLFKATEVSFAFEYTIVVWKHRRFFLPSHWTRWQSRGNKAGLGKNMINLSQEAISDDKSGNKLNFRSYNYIVKCTMFRFTTGPYVFAKTVMYTSGNYKQN